MHQRSLIVAIYSTVQVLFESVSTVIFLVAYFSASESLNVATVSPLKVLFVSVSTVRFFVAYFNASEVS